MKPSENSGFFAERREYKIRLELTLLKWLSRLVTVIDSEKNFSSSLKALMTKARKCIKMYQSSCRPLLVICPLVYLDSTNT